MTIEENKAVISAATQEPAEGATCVNPGAAIEQLLVALMRSTGQSVKELICSEVAGLHGITQVEINRLDTAIGALTGDSNLIERLNQVSSAIEAFITDADENGVSDLIDAVNNAVTIATTAGSNATTAISTANAAVTALNDFQSAHLLTISNLTQQLNQLTERVGDIEAAGAANTLEIASLGGRVTALEQIEVTPGVTPAQLTEAVCASYDVIAERLPAALTAASAALLEGLGGPCPALTFGTAQPPAEPAADSEAPPSFS